MRVGEFADEFVVVGSVDGVPECARACLDGGDVGGGGLADMVSLICKTVRGRAAKRSTKKWRGYRFLPCNAFGDGETIACERQAHRTL